MIEVKERGHTRLFSPAEILGLVLARIKRIAENIFLGHPITRAVITVPSNWRRDQVRAIVDASSMAGIEVSRVVSEATAAAFST